MTTDPLSLDRFTVSIHPSGFLVIADRDRTPVTPAQFATIMGDRDVACSYTISMTHGCLAFEANEDGARCADIVCAALNAADAENDALLAELDDADTDAEADRLIDEAATVAERIEAEATAPALTPAQRRAIAAYQRVAAMAPFAWSEQGLLWGVGDRVQIGEVENAYHRGALTGLGIYSIDPGVFATVILPSSPYCPLVVLTDDDRVFALPSPSLYVRRIDG